MHAVAHGGCADTVREFALKADTERKIPRRTGDSNPRQYCACFFVFFSQSDALPTELFPPVKIFITIIFSPSQLPVQTWHSVSVDTQLGPTRSAKTDRNNTEDNGDFDNEDDDDNNNNNQEEEAEEE